MLSRANLNGPNLLTFIRLLVVPILAVGFDSGWNPWLVLIIFLLAALTDLLDGWWARKSGLITDFGKLADPIADKALTGVAWISLTIAGVIPVVATVLVLVREVGITVLRLWFRDRMVQAADQGGKLKTTLQIVVISLLIVTPGYFPTIIWWGLSVLLWYTVFVTVQTGWNYLRQMKQELAGKKELADD
ncbi:MAG: CDP-diacylglycerol--glycerol-3-phosphate 3-phosphatidyltransferase [Actinomycetota bacterium]